MVQFRIVGLNEGIAFVQFRFKDSGDWMQTHMNQKQAYEMISAHFEDVLSDFDRSEETNILRFLYHYGEDEEMIRKGEAYIFTNYDYYPLAIK